jgi:hypothetical protein
MRKFAVSILPILIYASAISADSHREFIDTPEAPTPRGVEEGEAWKEADAALPPWPRDEDLVEFRLDNDDRPLRYYIDGKNLRTGSDGVVRYTLVVESGSGARNLSYEGLRCNARGEHRLYAYGINRQFMPQPESEWRIIPSRGTDKIPKRDMIRALEGKVRTRENAGFLPD